MNENILEKITNVEFLEESESSEKGIAFQIEGTHFCIGLKNKKGLTVPGFLIHYEGVCPFCKKDIERVQICLGFRNAAESKQMLFHYLTNHPEVRLKMVLRGE